MPINPEIILGYKAPQILSSDERQAKALNLQNLLQQNQEGALKLQAYKDQQAEDNNYKNLFRQKGAALTEDDLYQAGLPAQALAYGKNKREGLKSQAELEAANIKLAHDKADYFGSTAGAVVNNPTYENATYAIKDSLARGYISPEQAQSALGSLSQDPNQIRQQFQGYLTSALSAKDQLPEIKVVDNGGSNQIVSINKATQQPTVTGTYAKSQSPDNVATNERTVSEGRLNRANQLQIARERNNSETGKIPSGYRMTPEGNLQAIPGGPADLKLAGQFNQDTAALTGANSSFDRLATAANELLNSKGLEGITGMSGALPNIPGGAAADAQAKLDTLKSQVGFGVLQDMRNNSKTGGALGSVSDAEGKRLEANLAALDKAQSLAQMKESLKKIIDYSEQAKGRLRDAYNLKHGDNGNQYKAPTNIPSANLPPVNRKGWALHVDANGNKAYVSPNGKDYEEVK